MSVSPPLNSSFVKAALAANGSVGIISDIGMNLEATTAAVAGTWDTYRTRFRNLSGRPLKGIYLVYSNHVKSGTTESISGLAQIQVRAAFQRNGTTVSDQTGERLIAMFAGQRTGFCDPGANLVSQFIPCDIGVGETFYVVTAVTCTSGVVRPWGPRDIYGGVSTGGRNTGEGQTLGTDQSVSGNVSIKTANKHYCPCAILGVAADGGPFSSAVLYADSIGSGNNDPGYGRDSGGWFERAFAGQSGPWGNTSTYSYSRGFSRLTYGGEKAQDFNSLSNFQARFPIGAFATHEVHAHGTNDLGQANLQTWILNAAVRAMVAGRRVIRCTILPRTDSTDGWKTAASQTTNSTETGTGGRQTVNSWLRDTSSAGFVAQAVAAAIARNPNAAGCKVLDLCVPIEVNSSGVLTLNGGRWIPYTGALTFNTTAGVGTSTSQLVLTGVSSTIDLYRGMQVRRVANNEIQTVWYHPAGVGNTTVQFRSTFAAFASGDAFEMYTAPFDSTTGVHPSSYGHQQLADYVNPLIPDLMGFW